MTPSYDGAEVEIHGNNEKREHNAESDNPAILNVTVVHAVLRWGLVEKFGTARVLISNSNREEVEKAYPGSVMSASIFNDLVLWYLFVWIW